MKLLGRSKTTERITPAGKRFYKQMAKLQTKPYVKVGVLQTKFKQPHEGESGSNPLSLGEVAVVNEFGSSDGRVPERSYIRSTHDEIKGDVNALIKRGKLDVVSGAETTRRALGRVGAFVQGKIYNKILSNVPPPNAPSTVAQKTRAGKAGNKTLINFGQLLRSIGWEYYGVD